LRLKGRKMLDDGHHTTGKNGKTDSWYDHTSPLELQASWLAGLFRPLAVGYGYPLRAAGT